MPNRVIWYRMLFIALCSCVPSWILQCYKVCMSAPYPILAQAIFAGRSSVKEDQLIYLWTMDY